MVRSLMGDYEEIQYQCKHWVNKNLNGKAQSAVHVTNEEVRNRNQNAIWVHDDLLTIVKKRKFSWYRNISRSSGMAKTILQGTVKGVRRRGRQKKRWEDNIKEWTGMEFWDSLRAAGDRERWKVIVATSSVAPRRPSGLRPRWERWNMSRGLTKPTKVCAQRRLRSAWASAQSDQTLRCALDGKLRFRQTAKTLIRLGGCPGWSESSLGAQPFCWFCHVAAHMSIATVPKQFENTSIRGVFRWRFKSDP